jgi:hypothetical protein
MAPLAGVARRKPRPLPSPRFLCSLVARASAAEPEKIAADADIVLRQLQQKIAANEVVPLPRFAALPGSLPGK